MVGIGGRMMGRKGLVLVVDELQAFGSKTLNLDVGRVQRWKWSGPCVAATKTFFVRGFKYKLW